MIRFFLALLDLIRKWGSGVRKVEPEPIEHEADMTAADRFTSGIPPKPKVRVKRTAKRTPPAEPPKSIV